MILPPERDQTGALKAAKNVQGSLLPLLQDLQRLGPKYTRHDLWRFDYVPGSLPPAEIGEMCCMMMPPDPTCKSTNFYFTSCSTLCILVLH